MREREVIPVLAFAVAIGAAAITFVLWRVHDPAAGLGKRMPGMDGSAEAASSAPEKIVIGEFFGTSEGKPSERPGSWPRFRGPNYDNIVSGGTRLADKWPEGGPPILWSVEMGEGYAAAAVHRGRVYVLDYDEEKRADALRCLSLEDGAEIWRRAYGVKVRRNHGMSRTIPTVTDRHVVTIGPRCHVMCVDASTGALKWGIDLERDFGATTPLWYAGQCPMIDGATAVIGVGGPDVLLMGVDLESGKVLWKTPNPKQWKMSHASVMPMTLDGKRMYVYCAEGGIAGVSAMEGEIGRTLWTTTAWNAKVSVPSPVILGDGLVFVTGGYSAGSLLFKVVVREGKYDVEVLRKLATKEGLASEQQTPIFHDGHLFAVLPKDAGPLKQEFVCVGAEDHGKVVWSSGKAKRFGLGPFLLADGKFFILDDDGVLTLARARTDRYEQLDEAKVLDGHDSWGPLALVGGRMILRDSKRMICIDVSAK